MIDRHIANRERARIVEARRSDFWRQVQLARFLILPIQLGGGRLRLGVNDGREGALVRPEKGGELARRRRQMPLANKAREIIRLLEHRAKRLRAARAAKHACRRARPRHARPATRQPFIACALLDPRIPRDVDLRAQVADLCRRVEGTRRWQPACEDRVARRRAH